MHVRTSYRLIGMEMVRNVSNEPEKRKSYHAGARSPRQIG
jgi:hypothetical protein